MKVALGTDHAGFAYKERIKALLARAGHTPVDFGAFDEAPSDYPDFVLPAAAAVGQGACERGIVLGGSGNGEAIAANKLRGVRAAVCWSVEAARLARAHNDANVLSLGQRLISEADLEAIVRTWLETPFEGGRHAQRLAKLGDLGSPGGLPHQISTLLFCFDAADRVLLLERAREPNQGRWSPPGGKLRTEAGESPFACACREAEEELGWRLSPAELHLTGLVSEHGYAGTAHWLMFLFEVRPRLATLPPSIDEGRFRWFARAELDTLPLPDTDRDQLWPLFWRHRGGFFAAHCHCHPDGRNEWRIESEETRPRPAA